MIIHADARHIPLVDGCVQTCVTSPPYYGLRSYSTATWDGGDAACDHIEQRGGRNPETSAKQLTNQGTIQTQYTDVCKKCGAQRIDRQIGLEETPDEYVETLVQVFREVRRVLRDDGTLWLNLGDSYAGSGKGAWDKTDVQKEVYVPDPDGREAAMPKRWNGIKPKDLIGIPWTVALALRADGWYLRSDIIWHKPNPMPESVTDRPTKAHEYIFLLSKSATYYYDSDAIKEPYTDSSLARYEYSAISKVGKTSGAGYVLGEGNRGNMTQVGVSRTTAGLKSHEHVVHDEGRNKRTVWTVNTQSYSEAHFATFPEELIEPCILAGSRKGDIVFDPFLGSGTTGLVAERYGRRWVGTDIGYHVLSKKRTAQRGLIW